MNRAHTVLSALAVRRQPAAAARVVASAVAATGFLTLVYTALNAVA